MHVIYICIYVFLLPAAKPETAANFSQVPVYPVKRVMTPIHRAPIGGQGRVALSCAAVRALLRTHGLESTLMQRCAHGSAPVGALPWAQPTLCAPDWLNFALICNISDGLLDYAKVIAYLATHSQTNTYQSPQNRWHSSSHSPPASSAMLDCSITSLYHVTKSTGATFFCITSMFFLWSKKVLVRSLGRRRCIKECATAVAQVTGALLNAPALYIVPHAGWNYGIVTPFLKLKIGT